MHVVGRMKKSVLREHDRDSRDAALQGQPMRFYRRRPQMAGD